MFAKLPKPVTIERMACHFVKQIRAIQSAGPYRIGGFCNGEFVAYEAARQIESAGHEVSILALVRAFAGRLRWPAFLPIIDAVGASVGMADSSRLRWRRECSITFKFGATQATAGSCNASPGGCEARRIGNKAIGKASTTSRGFDGPNPPARGSRGHSPTRNALIPPAKICQSRPGLPPR